MVAPKLDLRATPCTAVFIGGPWDGLQCTAAGSSLPALFSLKARPGEDTQPHLYGGAIISQTLVHYRYFGPGTHPVAVK